MSLRTKIVETKIKAFGVTLKPKTGSLLMRTMGYLVWPIGHKDFLHIRWTTIGRTIYYPSFVLDPYKYIITLEHELVRVRQWLAWWILFPILYCLLPVPILFAWFRWRFEREAYLMDLRRGVNLKIVVRMIRVAHFYPWPESLMLRWFENARKEGLW